MPLVGLPTTVEDVLSTLLCNSTATSWKIAGTEGGSVFVLRLKGNQSQTDSAMTPAPVAWRRKPPSQQLRDQRRAEINYTKVGNKDSDKSNCVSLNLQQEDVNMCRNGSNENDSNRRPTEDEVSDTALHPVQHVPTTRTLCHIPLGLCSRLLHILFHTHSVHVQSALS